MRKPNSGTQRSYEGIHCPVCNSPKVVKEDRTCGKVGSCNKPNCSGCHHWVSSKQVSQSFRCIDCGNTWSIMSNY